MKKIVDILIERDGYTREEALSLIKEVQDMMIAEQDDSILEEELGLEPDYLEELLFEY